MFVCWVICFQSQKIQQVFEVASVACCLFAQYLKEELLLSVASSSIARDSVRKRQGSDFQGINSFNYARLSSIATKYESDNHLEIYCKLKPPLHVTFSS